MQWKDISIRTYQDKIYPIISKAVNNELEELDQRIDLMVALCGNTREHYDNMNSAEFYALWDEYRFLSALPLPGKVPQFIEIKGVKFAIDYNPTNIKYKLKARDIIDLSTISKDEKTITENMHRILAAYAIQEKKRDEERMEIWDKDEWMKDCDMQTAWDILGFFFLLLENCSPVILDYLREQVKTMPVEMEQLYRDLLQKAGDGTLPSTV